MEKPDDVKILQYELGGIELFVSSDENMNSSLKLNRTVILNKDNKIIGLNLSYCRIESLNSLIKFKDLEYLNLSNNLIEDIIPIKNFKKLKILDLGSNKIENIESISILENLEKLHLDNNQITKIPVFNSKIISELIFENNRIEYIENLKNLEQLFALNLNGNKVQDIKVFKFFKKLKHISLSSNGLSDISLLKEFNSLLTLDLSKNNIIDISPLKNLDIVVELLIGDNHIFDLSPLYFSLKRQGINFINAFNNPLIYPPYEVVKRGEDIILNWFDMIINSITEKITENKKSKSPKLDIGNMGLTDLKMIPELFDLKHLKELIISNEWAEYDDVNNRWIRIESDNNILKNNILNIPIEISKLNNLEIIIIGGDWKSKNNKIYNKWRIHDISTLFALKKLKFLNVSNNQVETISDIIKLESAEIIHLNNNNIKSVPKLSTLKKLREIYLSNNVIDDIYFLQGSLQIETIDLHSNQIKDLLPLEGLLRNSTIQIKNSSWEKKCISISNNSPSINPPYEVLNLSKNDFFLYLKQLEYESKLNLDPYYNKEIKVVLVGNSYSGKSTFLNYLKTKRFKKGLPSTHWLVTEELENINIGNEILKLRFFDFGGQDYYHDTHKMFFSNDSLYLLLWDENSNLLGKIKNSRNKSTEEIQVFPLEYWLDSIKIYAKKSLSESQKQMEQLLDERDRKINSKTRARSKGNWLNDIQESNDIINRVFNYKNILVIQNKIDIKKSFLNQPKLINEYPNIHDFVNISLANRKGLKQFHELYQEVLAKNLNYNRPLLATWGFIKDNLNDIFKNDDFIVRIDTFKNRVNDYLTIWLKNKVNKSENEISTILFKDEEIILFANFLKEIGLIIFDSENEKISNYIIVHQNLFLEDVYKILDISKDNGGKIEEISLNQLKYKEQTIQTLISHNIIFKNIDENNYIAPLFLPQNPSFLVNLLVDIKIPFRRFKFDGFIPKSIILSVFSKIINEEQISKEDFYFWKNGLIFKDRLLNQKVLLKFNIENKFGFAFIDILSFDNNSNDVFIKKIVDIVKNIISSECNEFKELLTLDGNYFVELRNLILNYENKINYIEIINFETKKVKQISIYKYNKFMEENIKKPNKKLFISYSKQDEHVINSFIKHLSSLQSDGLIESWYCTELKAGEDWDKKIKEKLFDADIVCFMVSPNFMSTPYIHKYEVKNIFKRYERGDNVKIVPIILDYINWSRKYNFISDSGEEMIWSLDKFTALPFTGKEITEFKNENQAWYIVENALRIIINDDINSEVDEDEIVRKFSPKIERIYNNIMANKI